uniref:Uncharacterized protein n=1 Tax=Trachysalambria curvirostris nimavirus TaxID=2984282 RepID=A0A9C7EYZ0_9VIRU|nr:MAG: hypothetical protein [Trachysalambria curvirostris nimavirus]
MEIDFKSLCLSVKCQDDIGEMIGEALSRQYPGAARTPASEIDKWDASDLLNFQVDPSFINRVYSIEASRNSSSFELVARQIYKGRALYLTFSVFPHDPNDPDSLISLYLYMTLDAQILLNSLLNDTHDLEGIFRSLIDDGYVDDNSWYFHSRFPHLRRTTPKLLYLCLKVVYNRWDKLKEQATAPGSLPKTLVKMIEDDRRIRDTRYDYEDGYDDLWSDDLWSDDLWSDDGPPYGNGPPYGRRFRGSSYDSDDNSDYLHIRFDSDGEMIYDEW